MTVRLNTNHELLFEVAKLNFCNSDYNAFFGGYHHVWREDSIFRRYAGIDGGYVQLTTHASCTSLPNRTPSSAATSLAAGGFRIEPIPALGIFAEARAGVMTVDPHYFGGVGGGLQLNLPF